MVQTIIMDKKLRETTLIYVLKKWTVNDKYTAKRGNLVTWYKFAFAVRRHLMLNLSNKPL